MLFSLMSYLGIGRINTNVPLTEFYGPFERSERGHHKIHVFWLLSVRTDPCAKKVTRRIFMVFLLLSERSDPCSKKVTRRIFMVFLLLSERSDPLRQKK